MDTRNFTFMFYGFAAAWAIIVVYVLMLVSRERKIHRELENVKKLVEYREAR